MKALFAVLILSFALVGGFNRANAQEDTRKIAVKVGKQKKDAGSQITVKFVSLIEDSRCPTGARCIQAGNARIKVEVAKAGSDPITFEMNTSVKAGETGGIYEGYAIYLTDLTPTPKANVRLNRNAYTATFSVSRAAR